MYLARVDLQHELGKLANDFSRANSLLDMQGKYHVESYSTPGLEMMHYVVTEVSAIHQQTSGCVSEALRLFGHLDVQAQILTFTWPDNAATQWISEKLSDHFVRQSREYL